MFQENWQKLVELQQGLLGIDGLAHHSRVSSLHCSACSFSCETFIADQVV